MHKGIEENEILLYLFYVLLPLQDLFSICVIYFSFLLFLCVIDSIFLSMVCMYPTTFIGCRENNPTNRL